MHVKTTMNATKTTMPAVSAGFLAFALTASAAVRTLPTPPPSEYVDTESSVVVPFPTDQGRQVTLTLSAPVSETNAIQVALGRDENGDEDLEPEETALVLGVDCLVPFLRNEGQRSEVKGQTVEFESCSAVQQGGSDVLVACQEGDLHSTTTTSNYNFRFRQPQKVADRFTHAKVTTRNMATTNAVILADIKRPGLILFLR